MGWAGIGFTDGVTRHPRPEGDPADWPEEVFLQISESQCGRAIRSKKWKYSVRAPDTEGWVIMADSDVYVEHYLYDLATDPHERRNLVWNPDLKSVREELATTLKRHMAKAGEREPTILPRPPG